MLKKSINSADINLDSRKRNFNVNVFRKGVCRRDRGL